LSLALVFRGYLSVSVGFVDNALILLVFIDDDGFGFLAGQDFRFFAL